MGIFPEDSLFQQVFEAAAVGMALIGLDGRFLHVNRALCELVGYTADELRRKSIQDITHPEDLEADLQHMRDLLSGQRENYQIQKRSIHRLGHSIPHLFTVSLLRKSDGEPRSLVAQIQELTALSIPDVSEGIFEQPVALHFVAGFDRYFKKLSPNWSETLGHSIETLLSQPYMDFLHPDDRQKTLEEAGKIESGQEVVLFENRYRHVDGTYHWLLWTAIPVVSEKLIYGVAVDYTRRKQIELGLRNSSKSQSDQQKEFQPHGLSQNEARPGLVKICAWTKQVYHEGKWITPEKFLRDHLRLEVTHGISEEGAKQFVSEVDSVLASGRIK